MKKLFERKEMKYSLTKAQAESFQEILSAWLVPDQYPEYDIASLYFDNDNFDLMRKSLDKPHYKEKLRMRSYGTPRDEKAPVFLEIKKKFEGIVYKRRIDLPLDEARDFIDHPTGDSVSEKEIGWLLKKDQLEPRIYISYHRKAWTWIDDPDLRITIDSHVQWRVDDLDLKDGMKGEELFDDDFRILEIKSTTNFPILLVRTLKALNIEPCSVSKAGRAYTKLLERGYVHGIS